MEKIIALGIVTLIGAFYFPIFTLGCILIHFNHEFIGVIIIIHSLTKSNQINEKEE